MDSGSNTPDTMEKPGVGHNTDGNGDSPTTVDDRQTLDRISNLIETSGAQVEQIEGWLDHFTPKKRAQLKQQVTLTPEPESVRELETNDGMLAIFKQMQLLQEQMQAVMRENAELKRTVQLQQTDTAKEQSLERGEMLTIQAQRRFSCVLVRHSECFLRFFSCTVFHPGTGVSGKISCPCATVLIIVLLTSEIFWLLLIRQGADSCRSMNNSGCPFGIASTNISL